jgi:hypothetical protein
MRDRDLMSLRAIAIYARFDLSRAIEHGRINRPNHCSVCKNKTRVQGHHTDYRRSLDVVWVCQKCHSKLDIKYNSEQKWECVT